MNTRIRILAAIVCVALTLPLTAFGGVLDGPFILDLMVEKLAGARTLQIQQQVTIEDHAAAESPVTFNETLSYLFPDRFRSDKKIGDTQRILVDAGSRTIFIRGGHRIQGPEGRLERYKDILLVRSSDRLHKLLLTYGVDVEKTSLGRFEDRIVYVLGAQYPDESVAQLWVDKESLLPLRWLDIPADNPQDQLEFIYRNWRKKDNLWYPALIEMLHNHVPVRRIDLMEMKVDPVFPPELFDIAYLIKTYPPERQVGQPEHPGKDVDEVQRTIEEFQKKFEE